MTSQKTAFTGWVSICRIGCIQFKTNCQPHPALLIFSTRLQLLHICGKLKSFLIPMRKWQVASYRTAWNPYDSKTQRLEKLKEGEVGSLERGVCSAQRMTGELPSPQSETRHHAAAPACGTMQQEGARQPRQTGTSAHSPLGSAHRADWETGTHHLSVAINPPPIHFCWRASNTQ